MKRQNGEEKNVVLNKSQKDEILNILHSKFWNVCLKYINLIIYNNNTILIGYILMILIIY